MVLRIRELVQQVGLEELSGMRKQELATDFMPAAVTGFADGDLILIHEPYTGERADLYGENKFGDGRVARAMARTAIENGITPGPIYDFQGLVAQYFDEPKSPFADYRAESAIHMYPEVMTIDGNPLVLPNQPSVVVDYGACLTGRSYISDQMNFLKRGKRPFTYSPLARMHFTNQILMNTYDVEYGSGTKAAAIKSQTYIGREDGVAAATDEMIRSQRAYGAPTEVVDVILCTSTQHTSKEDLGRGILNAYSLLKEGGMLVIRSLARPASDEIGTDEITGWAFESGFSERDAVKYEAGLYGIGTLMGSGHFGEREIKTVVIPKL